MRVLLDANIWISYLLAPNSALTIIRVAEHCFLPSVTLLFPVELRAEIQNSVDKSAYLRQRIAAEIVTDLIHAVQGVAEQPPLLEDPPDRVSRDWGDDYLVAYALLYSIDFLVTGDKDLLILGQIDSLAIVTPATFARLHLF